MGKLKDELCVDAYAKQQAIINDGCKCLIHHPTDPDLIAELRQITVTGNAWQAGVAVAQLGPCPGRQE